MKFDHCMAGSIGPLLGAGGSGGIGAPFGIIGGCWCAGPGPAAEYT